MKIKDIIKKVATMLQLNNVAEADFDEELQNAEPIDETQTDGEDVETLESEESALGEESNQVEQTLAPTFDSQTQRDINLLISCINSVLCDIATDHLILKNTETITVNCGEFALCNLSKSFHKLIDINTTKNYVIKNEVLYIENGVYEITYSYLPEEYDFDGDILDFNGKLTLYALCFGVASEYCLISGNYSESEMWNSRFENAMQTAKRGTKVPQIKGRKWL